MRPARSRLLLLTVACALSAGAASPGTADTGTTVPSPPTLADRLERDVSPNSMMRDLWVLQQAAEDASGSDGSRAVGTPGYAASADYVVGQLRGAGYQVERQPVPYTDTHYDAETLWQHSPVAREIRTLMTQFSPSTPDGGRTAELVVAPTERDGVPVPDAGCTAASYDGLDVTGKITLVPRAACRFSDQQRTAVELGAVAMLNYVVTPSPENIWRGHVSNPQLVMLPTASVSQADAESLARAAEQGPVQLTVELRAHVVQGVTENIIAETAAGDPNHVVMAGAHLDSVPEGPGINDNATSAVALLETARRLAPLQSRLTNKVRFAFWGAEELIVVGSEHYVAHLPAAEREAIAYYLNFELIAAPNWATFVMHVPDGGPGDLRVETAFTGYFTVRGLPHDPQNANIVGSDHFPFRDVGIAVGGLNGGDFAPKTPAQAQAYGGVAGQLYDHCYHQSCDTVASIDGTALRRHSRAIAWVIGDLAVNG